MSGSNSHPVNIQDKNKATNRRWMIIGVVVVLIPSALLIKSGNLLLVGLFLSVCLSWIFLRLQRLNWSDVGLQRFSDTKRLILTVAIALVVLILFSWALRHFVTFLLNRPPDLEAFKVLKGNKGALLIGLIIAWIFGAFCEEMLFRGFLINAFFKSFPENVNKSIRWGISLVFVSIVTVLGDIYQGLTGMIIAGAIGFCFGLIYLYSKRNLWPSILTHGIYDTIAFIMVFMGFNIDQIFK